MKLWEDNLMGFVRKEDWLKIGSLVPTRPNDPIDTLFGDNKTNNLVAKWESLAAEYRIPVMAEFHGFDTEANKAYRIPVDHHSIEKGLIKVKIDQSERLRALMNSGVSGDQELYNYVMDDGARLADRVITRTKVAKNELMAYGKVTIKENNLDLTVDYGIPADQLDFEFDFSEDADIAAQIQAVIDLADEKGVIINGILTSSKVLNKMRNNLGLQGAINGSLMRGQLITNDQLESYLDREFGISKVITNNLSYGVGQGIDPATGRPSVSKKKYYPENKITFFSTNLGGKLGVGLWGNTPEQDVAKYFGAAKTAANPYVFITQWAEKDPAVLWTKASSLFIPVLYDPYSLFIGTVQGDSLKDVTVSPMDGNKEPYGGKKVSTYQNNIVVLGNKAITGNLNFVSGGLAQSGPLAGDGYFLALHFDNLDPNATSVKIGLEPSAGTGLVEIIDDPDKEAVLKVTDQDAQKLKVVSSDGTNTDVQTFDLSGLKFIQGA